MTYTPAIGYKKITDLEDGTWYFHVRLGSAAGWGGISHFRFQIDTQDPEYFNITAMERTDLTEPTASFIFEAEDVISGIAHYEIQIDDSESQIWQDDGEHVYQTPILSPGRHTLIAKAVDRAGNSLANFTEFIVSALDAPIITDYPKVVDSWESFVVNGTTYPNAQVVIWMQARDSNPISHIIQSGGDGKFSFSLAEKIAEGKYKLWAEVIDERGARSNPTDKLSTEIQKPAFWRMGLMAINVLSIIIPLIALVFLLAFGLWFSWHKFMQMRKRVRKEVGEAEEVLSKSFDALRKSVASRLNTLEKTGKKRKLTAAEARLVRQLKKDLNAAEKSVRKEIKDIAKQVK